MRLVTYCALQYKCRFLSIFRLKMQKEWRIAPENDGFVLKNGHLFLRFEVMDGAEFHGKWLVRWHPFLARAVHAAAVPERGAVGRAQVEAELARQDSRAAAGCHGGGAAGAAARQQRVQSGQGRRLPQVVDRCGARA